MFEEVTLEQEPEKGVKFIAREDINYDDAALGTYAEEEKIRREGQYKSRKEYFENCKEDEAQQKFWEEIEPSYQRRIEEVDVDVDRIKNMRETYDLTRLFLEVDENRIEVFSAKPKNIHETPIAMYMSGGIGGRRRAEVDEYFLFSHETTNRFLKEGYTVFMPQYPGCGQSEGRDETGGSDMNIIPALESAILSEINDHPDKYNKQVSVLVGESRGGMMVYQALRDYPEICDAALIIGAPTDFSDMSDDFKEALGESFEVAEESLARRSVITWTG